MSSIQRRCIKPPLKLRHGWVTTSYRKYWTGLLIHAQMSVNLLVRRPENRTRRGHTWPCVQWLTRISTMENVLIYKISPTWSIPVLNSEKKTWALLWIEFKCVPAGVFHVLYVAKYCGRPHCGWLINTCESRTFWLPIYMNHQYV